MGYRIRHGYTKQRKSPTYYSWVSMKTRCTNKNELCYDRYGGRGITICERWMFNFPNFLQDMGERPAKNYSIDRINTDGNYEPGNCRWATRSQQAYNRRNKNSLSLKNQFWSPQFQEILDKYNNTQGRSRNPC
jgi:hypothetical protein